MGDVSSAQYRSERPVTIYPRPRFVPRPRFDRGYNARAYAKPRPRQNQNNLTMFRYIYTGG